jgi:hypothetical protein
VPNKKISELPLVTTYGPDTYLPIVDPATGVTSRILASDFLLGPTNPWSPASLTDLKLWVGDDTARNSFFADANMTTPSPNGGNVNGWKRMQAGGTVDLTNTLANPGVLRTANVNGKSVVEMVSNTTLSATGLTIAQANWYALIVYKTTNFTASLQCCFGVGDSVSPSNYAYVFPRENANGGQTRAGMNGVAVTVSGDVGAGWAIYEVGYDGTNFRLRVNGGSWVSVASAPFATASRVAVGFVHRQSGTIAHCPGFCAEAYLCDSWPSAADLTDSLAYAQAKFGL